MVSDQEVPFSPEDATVSGTNGESEYLVIIPTVIIPPSELVVAPEPTLSLPEMALKVAIECIGEGEETNNAGAFIRKISVDGKDGIMWCALFVSWCYEEAARRLGLEMPFNKHHRAKQVVEDIGKIGSLFKDPLLAQPGDLVSWHRGKGITRRGHIEIVEFVEPNGIVHTIAGNTGKVPAKVKRKKHDVSKERLFWFATLRKGVE